MAARTTFLLSATVAAYAVVPHVASGSGRAR